MSVTANQCIPDNISFGGGAVVLWACEIIHVLLFSVVFRVVRGVEPWIDLSLGLLLRKHLAKGDQRLFKKLRHTMTDCLKTTSCSDIV